MGIAKPPIKKPDLINNSYPMVLISTFFAMMLLFNVLVLIRFKLAFTLLLGTR